MRLIMLWIVSTKLSAINFKQSSTYFFLYPMQILKIVLFIIIAIVLLTVIIGYLLSAKGYDGNKTDHFDGKKFQNLSGVPANGLPQVFKYITTRKPEAWTRNYETFVRDTPLEIPEHHQVKITFVNHSTFILRYDNMTVLTDPVWSKRCSPVQFAGPARFRPPGVRFEDLPPIDLVVISHNHYDHLDKITIQKLIKEHNPKFVVPLGLDHLIRKWGATHIEALDWWQTSSFNDLKVKSVPANHFTSRGTFDRDQTLWCGYILEKNGHKVYFAGDTGYGDIFKEIGKHEVTIDVSLIPIGAYLPRWFMSPIHVSPKESVMIHKDVNSQQSIGMHFGTFALADDGPDRPLIDLSQERKKQGIEDKAFIVPEEGHTYTYSLK